MNPKISDNELVSSQYLPLSERKCFSYNLDTSSLYRGRIMQGIFYAADKEDFCQKLQRGLTMLEKEARGAFLISSGHLVNIVRKKLTMLKLKVDHQHDWHIIHQLSNYLVNTGTLLDFPILSESDSVEEEYSVDSEGNKRNIYFIRYHNEHKNYVDSVMNQAIEYVQSNNLHALMRLRGIVKAKEMVPLHLAQRYPQDWDTKIIKHLQFRGILQYPASHLVNHTKSIIITPGSVFN